jgi:hypothetical protein
VILVILWLPHLFRCGFGGQSLTPCHKDFLADFLATKDHKERRENVYCSKHEFMDSAALRPFFAKAMKGRRELKFVSYPRLFVFIRG